MPGDKSNRHSVENIKTKLRTEIAKMQPEPRVAGLLLMEVVNDSSLKRLENKQKQTQSQIKSILSWGDDETPERESPPGKFQVADRCNLQTVSKNTRSLPHLQLCGGTE